MEQKEYIIKVCIYSVDFNLPMKLDVERAYSEEELLFEIRQRIAEVSHINYASMSAILKEHNSIDKMIPIF